MTYLVTNAPVNDLNSNDFIRQIQIWVRMVTTFGFLFSGIPTVGGQTDLSHFSY